MPSEPLLAPPSSRRPWLLQLGGTFHLTLPAHFGSPFVGDVVWRVQVSQHHAFDLA